MGTDTKNTNKILFEDWIQQQMQRCVLQIGASFLPADLAGLCLDHLGPLLTDAVVAWLTPKSSLRLYTAVGLLMIRPYDCSLLLVCLSCMWTAEPWKVMPSGLLSSIPGQELGINTPAFSPFH